MRAFRYKIIVDNAGQNLEMTETIAEWKDNEKIGFCFDAGDMIKTSNMVFISENGKTTVRNSSSSQGSNYIHRCMFAVQGDRESSKCCRSTVLL